MELRGTIDSIVFRNEANGYTVMDISTKDCTVTAVGVCAVAREGENVLLTGNYTEHKIYGEQFNIESCVIVEPTTESDIEKYLSSGIIKGIGPATATLIVNHFGQSALDIIQYSPERLLEIRGVGKARMEQIAESYQENRSMQEIMLGLQGYGISTTQALKLYKTYGHSALARVRENPYRLAEDVFGIGFKTADAIALKMGIAADSPFRIRAGVIYLLGFARNNGHMYLPIKNLIKLGQQALNRPESEIESHIYDAALSGDIVLKTIDEEDVVYLPGAYKVELDVARRLIELKNAPPSHALYDEFISVEKIEHAEGIELSDEQRTAVLNCLKNQVTVVTGGPGTGKTTTINIIILALISMGYSVALCAPTGRAAKRMTETTGQDASTIHRLLEYMPTSGGGFFSFNEENPLEFDAVIVDEMSMIDVYLFSNLLKAISGGTKLIMVGDVNQLPSVGPGNVLRDIIESQTIDVITLNEIYRQAKESQIVLNAYFINKGESGGLKQGEDFIFVEQNSNEGILRKIQELCREYSSDNNTLSDDVQVLTPMRKGELGCVKLNETLQRVFNPKRDRVRECSAAFGMFREGDRIMQIKNDYKLEWEKKDERGLVYDKGLGAFNGDLGYITTIDIKEEKLTIRFDDDKIITYDFSQLDELELSYAITIHKSQGSEFSVVIMPIYAGPPTLMARNLFYTAVTRAKSIIYLIGNRYNVKRMVDNDYITKRYTSLKSNLKNIAQLLGE